MGHGIGHWYVEIRKQAYWRGAQHTWVNRYVLSGADPSAATALTVINALKGIENTIFPAVGSNNGVGFVDGKAYGAAGGPPFAFVAYNESLATATSTGFTGPSPGYASLQWAPTLETVVQVRTLVNGLSSTGKPVYLRKYFRGFTVPTPEDYATSTAIPAADLAKINTAVAAWTSGLPSGYTLIGVKGETPESAPQAIQWIANRQVPKGRKKKTSALEVSGLGSAGDVAAAYYLLGVQGGTFNAGSDSFNVPDL